MADSGRTVFGSIGSTGGGLQSATIYWSDFGPGFVFECNSATPSGSLILFDSVYAINENNSTSDA